VCLFTLEGHTSDVNSVAFSHDGLHIVSGSSDQTIKIWEFSSGNELRTIEGHTNEVNSVVLSPNTHYIISCAKDKTIKIWEFSTGEEVKTLIEDRKNVYSVAFSPNTYQIVYSFFWDKIIKIWEMSTGKEVKKFKAHKNYVRSIAISPDGLSIISGSVDKTVKIWEFSTGNELRTLEGHTGDVNSVGFSPDGLSIVSGSADNTVKIWEFSTGNELRTLEGHTGDVNSVGFSPDGLYIVSGSADNTVKIWDFSTGSEFRTLEGHTGDVNSVGFSPDGLYIVSGSADNTVKIWESPILIRINIFKILNFEINKGYRPSKLELVRDLNLKIDQALKTLELINAPINYEISELKYLRFLAEKVINNLDHPSLYNVMQVLNMDFFTARKLGKYLIDEGWLTEFPDIPKIDFELGKTKITEGDISVSKEKHFCLVHRGPIKGLNFICPECGTYYCLNCLEAIKENENACWSCGKALDPTSPIKKPQEKVTNAKVIKDNSKKTS